MLGQFVQRLLFALGLLLVQGLVLNRVQLFGYATPMLYILFLLDAPGTASRSSLLICAFLLGIGADMMTDTPGIAAASCTLLALCQPVLLRLFSPNENLEEQDPALRAMGTSAYLRYISIAVLLYYVTYHLLLSFSLVHPRDILLNILGGSLLTVLMLWTLAVTRKKKR